MVTVFSNIYTPYIVSLYTEANYKHLDMFGSIILILVYVTHSCSCKIHTSRYELKYPWKYSSLVTTHNLTQHNGHSNQT